MCGTDWFSLDVAWHSLPLAVAGLLLILAGLGRRRAAFHFLVASLAAVAAGFVGFVGGFAGMAAVSGRGEGVGILIYVGACAIAGVTGLAGFVLALWLIRRRADPGKAARAGRSWLLVAPGAALVLLAARAIWTSLPGTGGADGVALMVVSGMDPYVDSRNLEELRRRGPGAVRLVVPLLEDHCNAVSPKFDDRGHGAAGRATAIILLGEHGGPEALADLRRLLPCPADAHVSAMVATRLAARNDVQSAPEIRRLLGRLGPEDPMMDHALRALGVLGDAAAVPDLKRVATNPAAYYSNVQAAIRAMAAIGTAEASAALDEMAGDPKLARWVEEARGARL